MMAPSLITIFRDWGVNSAIIKYTAQYRAEDKTTHVKNILAAGIIFEVVLGLSLTLLSFLSSGFLATNIFQRPDIEPLIQIASLTVFAGALTTAAQSAFTGYERMELYSATITFQAIVKTILAPALVIMGFGAFGAILGTTIATLISGLISITILYLTLYRNSPNPNNEKPKITETTKTMLRYGLPLSILTILAGSLQQFYNFLIAVYCTDAIIGNYQAAVNFSVLITFFATPISTVLFPAFSKLNPQKEDEMFKNVFQYSVKYAAVLVVPAAAAVMALSQPAVSTLFGEKYTYAPLFLALMSVSYLYSAFGSLSLGSLINSQGRTEVNLKLTLISSAIGLPLSLLLIPNYGITGLIATTLTAGVPSLITGLWWVKKHLKVTVNWASSAKILMSSALAALITYAATSQLGTANWIKLAIGTTTFTVSYMIAAPLTGAINTMLRNIFAILEDKGVGELYIGDLNGIRAEANNHGKKTNQKINNFWAFNLIEKRIMVLGEEYGVAIEKVSERNTSKTCCLCGKQHNGRVERGLMVCRKAHKSINADVNGAVNILNVAVNGTPVLSTDLGFSGSKVLADPLLLRWNNHEWS